MTDQNVVGNSLNSKEASSKTKRQVILMEKRNKLIFVLRRMQRPIGHGRAVSRKPWRNFGSTDDKNSLVSEQHKSTFFWPAS